MFILSYQGAGAGKGVIGLYTTFRKLIDSAQEFVVQYQPTYPEHRSVWFDLIATESTPDASVGLQTFFYEFDKGGAVTRRRI